MKRIIISMICCFLCLMTMTSIQACSNMINQKPVLKAQRLDGDSILLTWDKIDHADGYILYRATKRNGTYYKIAHKSKKITSYSDHKRQAGTIYYYKMFAYHEDSGHRIYSKMSNIISKQCAPTQVKALKCSNYALNDLTLTWNSISDVDGYEIYYATYQEPENFKYLHTTSKNKVDVISLKSNSVYLFKVKAYVSMKGKKIYGNESEVYACGTRASAPLINQLKAFPGIISVDFKGVYCDGYYVQVSTSATFKNSRQVQNAYTIGDLKRNQTYYLRVKTYSIVDGKKIYSEWSQAKKVKTN